MQRLITGSIMLVAWLLLLFLAPFPLFWLAMSLLTAVALVEYLGMVLPEQKTRSLFCPLVFGLLPVALAGFADPAISFAALILALIALFLYAIARYQSLADPFAFISRSAFGYLYIGACSAHLVLLGTLPDGRIWLLLLTALIAASDSSAFYAGSLLGRHRLCPAISPKKTWEGFIGGILGGCGAGLLVAAFLLPDEGLVGTALIALLLTVVGAAGDLSESIIKRAFSIKDAGTILPGHGGLLDRIDSLLLAAPLLYYFLFFRARFG